MGSKNTANGIEKPSKHQKRKKRRNSSTASDSSVSIDEKLQEKLLKKLKKLKKKEKKKRKKKRLKEREEKSKKCERKCQIKKKIVEDLEKSRSFAPMTKEEWEKQQNTLRRVYDEETGRTRLIRGSGEIVEECVSRERQLAINKQATLKDGENFQKLLNSSNLK